MSQGGKIDIVKYRFISTPQISYSNNAGFSSKYFVYINYFGYKQILPAPSMYIQSQNYNASGLCIYFRLF